MDRNLDWFQSDDWDVFCPNLAFAYNSTAHSGTNYSPYEIIYGRIIKLPFDHMIDLDIEQAVEAAREKVDRIDAEGKLIFRQQPLDSAHRHYIREMTKHQDHLHRSL